jgi:UDP-N-acetylmuramoyl-L-alanyl-D-glutamate--2,6-diaminopimelate ligase
MADENDRDPERYQTVYAESIESPTGSGASGSVAAPTAGLHFTPGLLDRLGARGVRRTSVVLHVGTGTFRPVETEDLDDHPMHGEWCSIPVEARAALADAARIIAVGTTSVRTLEAFAALEASGEPRSRVARDGPADPAGVHVAARRRAADQLPPARLDAAGARRGDRPGRDRACARDLRRGDPRAVPLLQLRRRDADPAVEPAPAPICWACPARAAASGGARCVSDELIRGLPVTVARGDTASVRIGDLTEDSRTVVPGSLFVARAGLKTDGRAYAARAVEAGATAILTDSGSEPGGLPAGVPVLVADDVRLAGAVLAERLCGSPSRRLLLVGVTGTNGKSTVTHLIHQILNRSGLRCGMIGTVQVDDGTEVAPSAMTTPPAAELSRTLATMVDAGCDAAAMEVSSHAIDQRRTAGLSFDAAVFTNITGDHLDYHGTFEAYLETKRELFRQLDRGGGDDRGGGGPAVLNDDDPNVAATEARDPVRCSLSRAVAGGWRVERGEATVDGERLALALGEAGDPVIRARVPLIGAYNAMNTAQAVAVAWRLLERAGVGAPERARRIADALSLVGAPPGRLEPVHIPADDLRVFVDYAHTDDALARVLETLRTVVPEGAALWCVFGCGGDRDRSKRPRMARAVVDGSDRPVLTSDNPRTEPPSRILGDVLEGLSRDERDGRGGPRGSRRRDRGGDLRGIARRRRADRRQGAREGADRLRRAGRRGRAPVRRREVARSALAARRGARTGGVVR